MSGHPLTIALKLLLSRGVAGNGAFDLYPASWGWGIPQAYVDVDDVKNWIGSVVTVASGSYQWDVVEEAINEDPGSWLAALLARAGLFLTIRQGLITVRAGQAFAGASAAPYMPALEITDDDLSSVSISFFDPNSSIQCAIVTAQTATGSTSATDTLNTLPARGARMYDLKGIVFTNESAQRNDVTGRLAEMSCRIPVVITATARGLRLSELSTGDVAPLTTNRIHGRTASTIDGFDAHRCYVVQASPNYQTHTVALVLLAYPADTDTFAP